MTKRLELHEILCAALGSRNVYYQPPESIKMTYPCIVYEKDSRRNTHADDTPYITKQSYSVTVISKNADFDVSEKIATMPYSSFNRTFKTENLYHDVYQLYY